MERQEQIKMERMQRAIFAALLVNIMSTEGELTHDQIKFTICKAFGKALSEDEIVVGDFIERTLVSICSSYADQHNAVVEANGVLRGES